jgi:hypothetical protein
VRTLVRFSEGRVEKLRINTDKKKGARVGSVQVRRERHRNGYSSLLQLWDSVQQRRQSPSKVPPKTPLGVVARYN